MRKCRICGSTKIRELKQKSKVIPKCASCRKRTMRYGITDEQLSNFINNPYCEICGKKLDRFNLCIDHNHKTGEVRGILCREHNLMLGYAKDKEQILLNAIKYLCKGNLEVQN